MKQRNLVVHSDGTIYLFDNNIKNLEDIEDKLRKYTTNIYYSDQVRYYKLDNYSIWSIVSMNKASKFLSFLQLHSQNIIPDKLKQKILNKKVDKKQSVLNFDIKETLTLKINVELEQFQLNALHAIKPQIDNNCVIILPPRTGKTLIGLKLIEDLKTPTLILSEFRSDEIWEQEIKNKTNYNPDNLVRIETGNEVLKPITICPYSKAKNKMLDVLSERNWGLIIYDDAHKLPADKISNTNIFRAKYKLGMTATLARSDNLGETVFRSIGPKVYTLPWKQLEYMGYKNQVICFKVNLPNNDYSEYGFNSKIKTIKYLRSYFKNKKIVIVSHLVEKMAKKVGKLLNIKILSGGNRGKNEGKLKKEIIEKFNKGEIDTIICSGIIENLPLKKIDIMIALSYQGSSEREEIFRVGILKGFDKKRQGNKNTKFLFSLVTNDESDYFSEREALIKKYNIKYHSINYNDLIEGDWNEC